jgi:predicted ribosomally synthesized peptide with nif11-like leader
MKTLKEFIQRLEVDPGFEKKAQTFDNGEELMAFVKSEGYDFTLEQMTHEFRQRATSPPEADGQAPAPADATPSKPEVAAFPRKPETLPRSETRTASLQEGKPGLPREQSRQEVQKPQRVIPPEGTEEKATGRLFRSGGGRHRGFSPQRLKNVSGEDS